jgi:hypothetical protein
VRRARKMSQACVTNRCAHPTRVVVVAPVEAPRNASRAQIERPHQSGGNSADLVVSQGELRRIHLPRSSVNKPPGRCPQAVEGSLDHQQNSTHHPTTIGMRTDDPGRICHCR